MSPYLGGNWFWGERNVGHKGKPLGSVRGMWSSTHIEDLVLCKCENRVYERRGRWLEKLGGRKMHWFSFCFLWFSHQNKMSKAEREEKERVLKISEEMRTCQHLSQRLKEWVSKGHRVRFLGSTRSPLSVCWSYIYWRDKLDCWWVFLQPLSAAWILLQTRGRIELN